MGEGVGRREARGKEERMERREQRGKDEKRVCAVRTTGVWREGDRLWAEGGRETSGKRGAPKGHTLAHVHTQPRAGQVRAPARGRGGGRMGDGEAV